MQSFIPFIDLQAQRKRLGASLEAATASCLEHGNFIMGPEVGVFEERLADFCGVKHCVTCANGTDALMLILMAEGIGEGDAVFVPAFTFVATAEAVAVLGATPIFCDVDPVTFNLAPASLEASLQLAEQNGLAARAVIAVDLFGQPADYVAIDAIARRHNLMVIADAAQSCGASLNDQRVGGLAKFTATSFFPAKPLGCYGDGGAVLTNDDDAANVLRSLRVHGKGTEKYDNVRLGLNSRLDTIQAAILIEKLTVFPEEIEARANVANRYSASLSQSFETPQLLSGATSVWAQYTIKVPNREEFIAHAKSHGVPTGIYYPRPLTKQGGYAHFPSASVNVSEQLAKEVISLPMHPYLEVAVQDYICEVLQAFMENGS